jgi:hypothetical protein
MLATVLLFSHTSQAGIILMEDFNDGVADGWNLNAGSFPATLSADPVNATLALAIETAFTGPLGQIAETPSFDLSGATFAQIMFDFSRTGDPQATRWVDVEFWDGGAWSLVQRIVHNVTPATGLTYVVNSGLGVNNKFRFEGKADSGGSRVLFFDNVKITSDVPVPVPSSLLLLGTAALLLLGRRRLG